MRTDDELKEWIAKARLTRASGTKLHDLRQALSNRPIVEMPNNPGRRSADVSIDSVRKYLSDPLLHTFVIEHDWAALIAADDCDLKDVRLPYPLCTFEFNVSQEKSLLVPGESIKRVIALALQNDDDLTICLFEEIGRGNDRAWAYLEPPDQIEHPVLMSLATSQIKAICVALDAEVVEIDLIRAPIKLNKARERRGKLPLADYHTIKIGRRDRPDRLLALDAEKRNSPRLHFRRGHWVHFRDHKTWRKWTLVGDPDLGFFDKHYRL
jgi:hypothetical protein